LEKTFIMVKPDGVQRGLIGEVINKIEKKGFKLLGLKLIWITEELAFKHYAEHQEKPFFKDLVSFITSGPVVGMVWQGTNVISSMRLLLGKTNPIEALPGTIRGDRAVNMGHNVVHGSDSPEAAEREITLFFHESEILNYQRDIDKWILN